MKKNFVTTLLGLGLGLAVLDGQDAIAQKRVGFLPDSTVKRLRAQAFDMTLPVFENKEAEDSVRRDIGKRYTDYRRGVMPKNRAVFPHGPGYAGIYTTTNDGSVSVKQITTGNLKKSVEITYEPAVGNANVIGGFTVTHSDTSNALSPLQSQSYQLDSTSTGYTYRKVSEQLAFGQMKTGRVTATRKYNPDGSREDRVSHKTYKNNALTDSVATPHGVIVAVFQKGGVAQTNPDTSASKVTELKASVQKAIGSHYAAQIEPFYPELQKPYTGPVSKMPAP